MSTKSSRQQRARGAAVVRSSKKRNLLLSAAKVIGFTKETRNYLKKNDPKALEQLDNAISVLDGTYLATLQRAEEVWEYDRKVKEFEKESDEWARKNPGAVMRAEREERERIFAQEEEKNYLENMSIT